MKYVKARTEMVLFDNSDVVTTSAEEWNWEEIDKEYGCDGGVSHVVKDF